MNDVFQNLLQNPKAVATGILGLMSVMTMMYNCRKALSLDKFESYFTMRLARLGMLIASPFLYPYFVGRPMVRMISRRVDKSKIKLANKLLYADKDITRAERIRGNAEKSLTRTRAEFNKDLLSDPLKSPEGDFFTTVGTYILGAIPITLVVLFTWVPSLRTIDIGVTETLSQSLQMAGEWLVSVGDK